MIPLLLLLTTLGFASDTADTDTALEPTSVVDPDAPTLTDLSEGSVMVPYGSLVVFPPIEGESAKYTLPAKYWLLPDPHLREAVVKAKQLGICQPALDTCTEKSLAWQQRTYDALEAASVQFDEDEGLVDTLTTQVQEWETRALVAESKNKDLKTQRNTAIAITGGLILGAVAVTVVAVAP